MTKRSNTATNLTTKNRNLQRLLPPLTRMTARKNNSARKKPIKRKRTQKNLLVLYLPSSGSTTRIWTRWRKSTLTWVTRTLCLWSPRFGTRWVLKNVSPTRKRARETNRSMSRNWSISIQDTLKSDPRIARRNELWFHSICSIAVPINYKAGLIKA